MARDLNPFIRNVDNNGVPVKTLFVMCT